MSPSDLLRARLAPADPLEAVFVAQAILASEELASLASRRPEAPDPRWLRHYSQAQNVFRRALADLEKLRKTTPAPAPARVAGQAEAEAERPAPSLTRRLLERLPAPTTAAAAVPTPVEPAPQPASPAWPEARNRRERRLLEALKRAARHRHGHHAAAASPPG
jgi:hypothetical protein